MGDFQELVYEVFQRGPDGRAAPPEKWGSYGGENPLRAPDVDNRTKDTECVQRLR